MVFIFLAKDQVKGVQLNNFSKYFFLQTYTATTTTPFPSSTSRI